MTIVQLLPPVQLSEVAIPHFVAATIFSAGAGQREIFLKNANVLLGMTFAYGILR